MDRQQQLDRPSASTGSTAGQNQPVSAQSGRRLARLHLSAFGANDILGAMRGEVSIGGLPDDARVVRVGYDLTTDDVVFVLASASFEPVPDHAIIPEARSLTCHRRVSGDMR